VGWKLRRPGGGTEIAAVPSTRGRREERVVTSQEKKKKDENPEKLSIKDWVTSSAEPAAALEKTVWRGGREKMGPRGKTGPIKTISSSIPEEE